MGNHPEARGADSHVSFGAHEPTTIINWCVPNLPNFKGTTPLAKECAHTAECSVFRKG